MRRSQLATMIEALAALALAASALLVLGPVAPAAAVAPTLIEGSGSSWAYPAITTWISNLAPKGVDVVYNPDGDAAGRQDFANRVSDFAVTADGYQGFTSANGTSDTAQGRPYAYLPIAAGGTSFPYQIIVDGAQVRTLRLSGETLAKIFTGQITNWSNDTITKDNDTHALPTLPIVPVVQSQGSGATEQLTNYFAREYPSIWQPYAGQSGPTEYYPVHDSQMKPTDGSSNAINYVTSSVGNGSIAYVEYSYALDVNYPVVKLLNSDGYYTLPTKYNVAVSLEAAVINMNPTTPKYLLQTLNNVYTNADPRTYPLSSYVYMIEPTGAYPNPESKITTGKRQALADFAYYAICQGQTPISNIGYSPLPVNLVEAGFGQINKLKAAAPTISLTKETILNCDNPTFVPGQPNENYLAEIAPSPPACDHTGAGPCAPTVTPNGLGSTPNKSGSYGTSTSSGASGPAASASTAGSSSGAATSTTVPAIGGVKRPTVATGSDTPKYVNATLAAYGLSSVLARVGLVVAALLLVVFAVPVVIGYRRSRRRGTEP